MTMATETVKVVPLTCHGHSRPITHISFSSVDHDDQYYLISACKDNNPMLRNGVTGDWIGTFLGHKGAVWSARLSADATLAATGSADFSAKVWDTQTGEALHTLDHPHIVRAVAFPNQPHPQILATGSQDKKLRIFDLSRSSASSSPTGVNGSSPTPSYEIGSGAHQGSIKSIVWGNDPNILITASEDKRIRWWDLRTQSTIGEYTVEGTLGSCEMDNISIDGGSGGGVLSVAAGKTAYFFDARQPARLIKSIKTDYDLASVALHSGQGKFVAGSSGDTWVRVFDFESEQCLEVGKGHHGPVWTTMFSPDGKLYATGSEDGTIKLWKFTTGPYGLWR
ncbi:WD40-repeat-containing domain protein [Phyllosticta citricarpa]